MHDILYQQEERLLPWACERIGVESFRPDAQAIGLSRDGEVVGVVVYDNFSPADVMCHIASDGSRRWMIRPYLFAVFAFPFLQCGMRRITGLVESRNKAALRFDKHLGFQVEGMLRHGAPDDDVYVLGMLREECRWISKPGEKTAQPWNPMYPLRRGLDHART